MHRPKVVVTNPIHSDALELLRSRCTLMVNDRPEPWSCCELKQEARDAVGLMAFMTDCINADFLDACPELRIVASVLKGHDNFDVAACTKRNVWFSVVPNRLTAATAELTIGLLLAISRHVVQGDAVVRDNYVGWRPMLYGMGLEGST